MDLNKLYNMNNNSTLLYSFDENGYVDRHLVCYKEFEKFKNIDEYVLCDDNPENILIFDKKEFNTLCRVTFEYYKQLPNKFKTKKLSEELFNRDKKFFELIPDKHKTKEMCVEACEFNINFIKYVPDEFKTRELYHNTLSKFSSNFIKDKFDLEFELFDI